MRKFASLFVMAILCSVLVFAQNRVVSGTVTDANGKPVPFASVTLKGTKNGVTSDAEGRFTISNIPPNATLVITSVGFDNREVSVGTSNNVSITMVAAGSGNLSEVVVTTAFNIKRAQRNVSYTSQTINSDALNTIRQQNLNSALAGKIAGLQLREQSYVKLGSTGSVRLRGEIGAAGASSGSILYVVDGTPMNSNDINPDDIEDVSVLQGVAATAIFGDRASSGAIVITTKKGRTRKGVGIEVNTGVRFDKVYILPRYQNDYAGGAYADLARFDYQPGMPTEWQALDGKYYHDYTDDASWGPRMAGQEYIPWYAWYPNTAYSYKTAFLTPQPDNIRDFYGTGVTTNNNINFSRVGDGFALRTSYTYLHVDGLEPNSEQAKHTLNGSIRYDLSNHFTVSTNFNYVTENLKGEFNDGYANQSTGSFNSWFHRNLDLEIIKEFRGYRAPGNLLPSWNHLNPGSFGEPIKFYSGQYWFNFYDYFDNVGNDRRRDRLIGDVAFTYKMNNHFNVSFTTRKNQVTAFNEAWSTSSLDPRNANGSAVNNVSIKAGYSTGSSFAREDNYELLGSYNNKWGDIALNANAGGSWRKNQTKAVGLNTRDGLNVPDLFSLSNSVSDIGYSNDRVETQVRSIFGRFDVGYKNFAFLEATLRNDWFSTLDPENNNILYKSFGGSFVFTDLMHGALPFLNYGKVRASWGQVPTSLGAYALGFTYGVGADQWNGNFLMGTPNTLVDPSLKGATNSTLEFGLELRFLKSRISLDLTYYDEERTDEPISVAVTGTSGFTNKLVNVGKAEREGIQVALNTVNIRKRNFTWNTNINFSYTTHNEVIDIAPGIDRIVISQGANFSGFTSGYTANFPGYSWGQMVGYGVKKNDQGIPLVVPSSGHFVRTDEPVKFGSVLPKYTGGFLNQFTYKNFVGNVNVDFQSGGRYFSLSDHWGAFSGLLERTAELNDKGVPVRDPVSNGGGVHVVGVSTTDGRPVDMYIDAQDYFHQFHSANIVDQSIYSLTYVKLREVSVGYKIPIEKLGNMGKVVQNATFSVVARNPWLIYTPNRNFDPGEISSVFGENGQTPGTRSLGFNLKVGF